MLRAQGSFALGVVVLASLGAACTTDNSTGDGGVTDPDAGAGPVWVEEPGIPTEEDLFAIWGRARDDIYAVGWNGTIIHYDGVAWVQETTTATVPLDDVHGFRRPDMMPMPNDPIFAVGWNGTLIRRADDGTWSQVEVRDTRGMVTSTLTQDLFGIFTGAEDNALAVGAGGKVLGWNGMTWTTVRFRVPSELSGALIEPLGVLKGVWSPNGNTYFISGSGGAAYQSQGGFMSFAALDTRVNEPLRGVWGVGGGAVFAVGLGGLILRYDGSLWRKVTNDGADELPAAFFFDIDGTGLDDITVVGWRGTAVRYSGGRWAVEETGTENDLRSVWIDPTTGVAFAVGATGTVIRRDPPPPPDAGI